MQQKKVEKSPRDSQICLRQVKLEDKSQKILNLYQMQCFLHRTNSRINQSTFEESKLLSCDIIRQKRFDSHSQYFCNDLKSTIAEAYRPKTFKRLYLVNFYIRARKVKSRALGILQTQSTSSTIQSKFAPTTSWKPI